jgi:nitroreductase
LLEECVEIALQAPTASNGQEWQFLLVDGIHEREAIARLYRKSWDEYADRETPTYPPGDPRGERQAPVSASSKYLRDHLHEVPAMVIPCVTASLPPEAPLLAHASVWGSIVPAAWSFMLAARVRGLGATWTTLHLRYADAVAEMLDIPNGVLQTALLPVAFHTGDHFKPATRVPTESVIHWNRW